MAETTWSTTKQTINKPFGTAAQTALCVMMKLYVGARFHRHTGKHPSRLQKKKRRGLQHFQAEFHQDIVITICTFPLRKAFCWPSFMKDNFIILNALSTWKTSRVKASSLSGTSCLSAPELVPICSAVTSRNTCALVHYAFLDTSGCGSGLDDSQCRLSTALVCLLTAPAYTFTVCIDVSSRPVNYGNNSSFFAHPLWTDCKPSWLQLIYLPDRLNEIHCSTYVLYSVFAFALLYVGIFSAIVIHEIRNILH